MSGAPLPLVERFQFGLAAPICLTWELTYACNLACRHCLSSSGRRDPRELSTAECNAVIDELERMQVFYVNIGGGEPTVRPDFWDLVDYATGHRVGVKFSTNGVKITPEVARRLAASDYVDVQISLGRGADVWDELHPTAQQQRDLYNWLVERGEQVLTGDSFFHLAAFGESLPGLNLCGAGRVVCLIDPVGDVYACPFAIHDASLTRARCSRCPWRPPSSAAAVAETERRWGGLDAALAVAGVIAGGVPAWEVPADQEQAVLDIDLGGVLNLARVAVPALLRRPEPRRGRFLAVASTAATRGLPMLAAFCAAKAGVAGFIRALAVELRGTGITANAVSPGSTATPILDESARLYGLPSAESFAPQQPLGRLLDPAEVAAVLAFLAGDGASGMTGAIVPVDGGLAL